MIESRIVGVDDGKPVTGAAQGVRVLIVGDSPVARRVLRSSLQACDGFAVVAEAGDPFEARDLILSHDPDVLTLDIETGGPAAAGARAATRGAGPLRSRVKTTHVAGTRKQSE